MFSYQMPVVILICVVFLGLNNLLFSQSKEWVKYLELHDKADSLYRAKNYDEAKTIYAEMLSLRKNFCMGYDLYRYVYCLAYVRDTVELEDYLLEFVQTNWFEQMFIYSSLFKSLHTQPYWHIIDSIAKINGNKSYVMIDSLAKMADIDRKVRRERGYIRSDTTLTKQERDSLLNLSTNLMLFVDSINVEKLKILIDLYGFPTWKLVGKGGVTNAWLIAQHARSEFQEWYFERYEQAVKEDNADITHYATMMDRIRTRKKTPQLYGTQGYTGGSFQPIEDIEHLNDRRETVLLRPIDISKIIISDYPTLIERP